MKKLICGFILFIGTLFCGIVVAHPSVFAAQAQQGAVLTPNVCPEGQYLDLTTDYCRNLDKNFGFDANDFAHAFPDGLYVVDSCTEGGLRSALDKVEDGGGGTVQLPACTINVDSPISLPNNLIIQGKGPQKTVIKATSGLEGNNLISIKHGTNVIVRDMSIDGDGHAERALLAWYTDNILFERLELINNDSSGMVFRYTSRITIRYIESYNNRENHGIGSKDCFDETLEGCKDSAGDVSPGVLWSQDFAIYSNNLHHNGKYGLDSHADYGEIAGNLLENNGYGSKFPDASYVWIHRNRFNNNGDWGTHIYTTLKIPEQDPQNIVFYENEFAGNGDYPIIAASPSKNIYMMANRYQNNSPNKMRIDEVTVYVCSGTEDAALAVDGTDTKTASAAQCDTSSVAHLFGEDGDSPDDLLPEEPANPTPGATTVPSTVQLPDPTPTPANTPAPGDDPLRDNELSLPGRIEAEDYMEGGEGVGYHDTTKENEGNVYRKDGVDIQATSDSQGAYNVGWIEEGEWLAYHIQVHGAGEYLLKARVRSWDAEPRSMRVEIDRQDVSGSVKFTQPATGENWFDIELGSVELASGPHTMRIVFESSGFNFNYIDAVLTKAAETPVDNPGGNPGSDPGTNPGDNPGSNPGDNPGGNPGNNPGGDPTDSLSHSIYLPVIGR